MLGQSDTNPVLGLFEKYRAKFDSNRQLSDPAADLGISDLWQSIQRQQDISQETLCERLSELTSTEHYLREIEPPAILVQKIPRKFAEEHLLIPLDEESEDLPCFAVANPFDREIQETLRFIFGTGFRLVLAPPENIELALNNAYEISLENNGKNTSTKLDEVPESEVDRAVPLLARQILTRAIKQKASDIHIQPFSNAAIVRLRVDGLLQRLTILPERVAEALIRYFKAHSEMDPTLSQLPQDGRMLVEIDYNSYDLRLSSLPVAGHQEKMVIRLLNRRAVFELTSIGFSLDEIHTINRMTSNPSGVILVCGPTGSGKTTTLYSILSRLNKEDTSIMTVENPVEYQIQGLSQTEVNEKAGMTFPAALRTMLRQDPDVILIGEIRDSETAQIALQAAMTGHLVFSTLHTNNSLSAIPRLLDLGVNQMVLAEALTGIISQRLLRKLCANCKETFDDSKDPLTKAFQKITRAAQAFQAKGCDQCQFSGYSGRTVIAELIEISAEQRELLLRGENDPLLFRDTMKDKFNSLALSASRLIISGETTISEATSVLGQNFWVELANQYRTEIPDMGNIYPQSGKSSQQPEILVLGSDDIANKSLCEKFEEAWFTVLAAHSPEAANASLQENEAIAMVILNVDSELADEDVVDLVAGYRQHIAWARIPALIRLPTNRYHLEQLLRDNGATSRFVFQDTPLKEIIEMIQHAISDNLDFKWGLSESIGEVNI